MLDACKNKKENKSMNTKYYIRKESYDNLKLIFGLSLIELIQ